MEKEPPHLFPWGEYGVPAEFESYVNSLEISVRQERGEDISQPRWVDYAKNGVVRAAELLLEEPKVKKVTREKKKERRPKFPAEAAGMIYLLQAYCAKWKQPAPPGLLRLTFEALGLKEHAPAPEIQMRLLGSKLQGKVSAFLEAARLDGEASAAGRPLNAVKLGKSVGVDHKTIRRWRKMRPYQQRRDFCMFAASNVDAVYSARKGARR